MSEYDHKQDRPKPSEPQSPEAPRSDGPVRGVAGVLADRQGAVDKVRYRLTGGTDGVGPAAHLASERRSIIGTAAARIMRKASVIG